MKLVKFLTGAAMVFSLAASASAQTTSMVIDAGLGLGNGDFEITDIAETSLVNAAAGAMGQFIVDRPRFLTDSGGSTGAAPLDLFDLSTINDGRGTAIDGWTNYRTAYSGGNGAHGFDGLYGLAPSPFGTSVGGQVFTNSGSMALLSDAYTITGAGVGDTFNFSCLVGSDQSSTSDYRSFLVFDDTTIVELTVASATDVPQGNFNRDQTATDAALQLSDSLVTTAAYSTVRVLIASDVANGGRALIDDVRLEVTTSGVVVVLLGDVNTDGTVDFLDISPFIAVLSGGGFQAEADCNEDTQVDFLDISPFIGILSGGGS